MSMTHYENEYEGNGRTSSVDVGGETAVARLSYADSQLNSINKKLKPHQLVASRILERAKKEKKDATGDLRELCIRMGDMEALNGAFFQGLLDVQNNIKDKDKDWDRKYLRYAHYYLRALTSVDGDIEGRLVKRWKPMLVLNLSLGPSLQMSPGGGGDAGGGGGGGDGMSGLGQSQNNELARQQLQHRRHSRHASTGSTGSSGSGSGSNIGLGLTVNINNVNSDSSEGCWRMRGITAQQLYNAIDAIGRPVEAMHAHLPRRMAAYKTVAMLAAEAHSSALVLAASGNNPNEARLLRRGVNKAREVLKPALDELSALLAPDPDDKKAKKVKKKEGDYLRKLEESAAVLSALRHCPPLRDDIGYLPNILQGCASQHPIAARHAFALLFEQSKLYPTTILKALADKNWLVPTYTGLRAGNNDTSGGGEGMSLNLTDELGCVYYLRALKVVVFAEVSYWDESKRLACYLAVSNSVKDEKRNRVALEAIQCIMGHERAWELLLEAQESCREAELAEKRAAVNGTSSDRRGSAAASGGGGGGGGGGSAKSGTSSEGILQKVVKRLEDCLGVANSTKNWPLAHATCRVCREVGKTYQLSQSHGQLRARQISSAAGGSGGGSGGGAGHVVSFASNPGLVVIPTNEATSAQQKPFDVFSTTLTGSLPTSTSINGGPVDDLLDLPSTPVDNGSGGFGSKLGVGLGVAVAPPPPPPAQSLEEKNVMCIKALCEALKFLGFLDSPQSHVRALALEAAFLLLPGTSQLRDDKELNEQWAWLQSKIELCPSTLPEHLLEGVIRSLLTRVECSAASRKETLTVTLDILEAFMRQRPRYAMARTLLNAWMKCLQFDDACRQLVLTSVFNILDSSFPLPPPDCPDILHLPLPSSLLTHSSSSLAQAQRAPSSSSSMPPPPFIGSSNNNNFNSSSSFNSTSSSSVVQSSNVVGSRHRKTGTNAGSIIPNSSMLPGGGGGGEESHEAGSGSGRGGSFSGPSGGSGGGGGGGGGAVGSGRSLSSKKLSSSSSSSSSSNNSIGINLSGSMKRGIGIPPATPTSTSSSTPSNSTHTHHSNSPSKIPVGLSSSSVIGNPGGLIIPGMTSSNRNLMSSGGTSPNRPKDSRLHGRRDSSSSTVVTGMSIAGMSMSSIGLSMGSPALMATSSSSLEDHDGQPSHQEEENESAAMKYWRERCAAMELKRMAYWLLGEYCCELTGYSSPHAQQQQQQQQQILQESPRKQSQQLQQKLLLFSGEFTPPPGGFGTHSSSSSPYVSSSIVGAENGHEVLPAVNDAAVSMLLRLKQTALFEDSDTRKAAVTALCEMALRLPDPIRFDVYVFLVQLHDVDCADPDLTLPPTMTVSPSTSTLKFMGPLERYVQGQVASVEAFSTGRSCGLGGIIGPVVDYLDLYYERLERLAAAGGGGRAGGGGGDRAEEEVRAVLMGGE